MPEGTKEEGSVPVWPCGALRLAENGSSLIHATFTALKKCSPLNAPQMGAIPLLCLAIPNFGMQALLSFVEYPILAFNHTDKFSTLTTHLLTTRAHPRPAIMKHELVYP